MINGDGLTSRDFCYVANVVQMNLLSANAKDEYKNNVFNVAVGDRTSLNELFGLIQNSLLKHEVSNKAVPIYQDLRVGDVKHSQADITKARDFLDYNPSHNISQGIDEAMAWYINFLKD